MLTRSFPRRAPGRFHLLSRAVGVAVTVGAVAFTVSPAVTANDEESSSIREIARTNGLSTAETREILDDHTAVVDRDDRIYFVEPATEGPATPLPAAAGRRAVDTFALHSKPDSNRVIFLDFDGTTVSGTAWNASSGVSNGFHEGWDPSNDGAAFNASELAAIEDIFYRVAEDFAPFDVDVTTEEPPASDITRSGSSDQRFGTRVLISESDQAYNAICGRECGGVAYIGVYDITNATTHSYYQPAWVFSAGLSDDPKNIAEATSHEVGHNLGLSHDGRGGSSYYSGHNGWAPIMGVGYSHPISQWSKGEYLLATETEDDFAVIANNGVVERADEAGGTTGTSADAVPAGTAYISDEDDVDVFALGTCVGDVTLDADVASVSPNLDVELTLLDASGTVSSADPTSARTGRDSASGLDATLTETVPAGSYWARVDGIGRGTVDNGYSDYGSVGAYTLTVDGCGSVDPATVPDAPTITSADRDVPASELDLTWTAPTDDGGSALTGYRVYVDGSQVATPGPAATSLTIDLDNDAHTVALAAVNSIGEGTRDSVQVSAVSAPAAPAITGATRDIPAGELDLTWTAPGDDGGSAVTGYRVFLDGDLAATPGAGARSFTLDVDNGAHTVAIAAVNAVGESTRDSRSITAVTVPGAPTLTGAFRDIPDGELDLTWTPPAQDGNTPRTGYRIFVDGAQVASPAAGATSTSILLDNDAHTVAIAAVNSVGEGSRDSTQVSAVSVPGLPTVTELVRSLSAETATLTFGAPASNGGTPVTGYAVYLDGDVVRTVGAPGSVTLDGVDNGAHTVAVAAVNAVGEGSRASRSLAAVDVPSPVGNLIGARLAETPTSVGMIWSTPDDGGAPITRFEIDFGGTTVSVEEPNAVVDIGSGQTLVTVYAVNAVGRSEGRSLTFAALPDEPAEPQDEPEEPTVTKPGKPNVKRAFSGARGGKPTAGLRWRAPRTDGGATISRYQVMAMRLKNGRVVKKYKKTRPASKTRYVRKLPRGTYVFRVRAKNTEGWGGWSGKSNRVRSR